MIKEKRFLLKKDKKGEEGGAALEYLIVTIFALLLSLTLLAFCGKIISEKLNQTFVRLGMEPIEIDISFLKNLN